MLACVFSQLALRDGCVGAASVCKQWRGAWRKMPRGCTGPVRLGVGSFAYGDHMTALAGGVVISDYNEGHCLHLHSSDGVQVACRCSL